MKLGILFLIGILASSFGLPITEINKDSTIKEVWEDFLISYKLIRKKYVESIGNTNLLMFLDIFFTCLSLIILFVFIAIFSDICCGTPMIKNFCHSFSVHKSKKKN